MNLTNGDPCSMIRKLPLIFLCLAIAFPASAASSAWYETPGGAVRLVTSGISDAQGKLAGALQIRLEPGWKTYWRDPGKTGIPPQIDIDQKDFTGVEVLFPVPQRFSDPYGDWAGYAKSITLPVIFHTRTPETSPLIDAQVFLGICQTVCIPVQATFTFDASAGADNPMDSWTIQSALTDLPLKAQENFRLSQVELADGQLKLHAILPEPNVPSALFLSATEGGQLGLPQLVGENTLFEAHIITPPKAGADIHYTLVQGDSAVSGTFPYPPE